MFVLATLFGYFLYVQYYVKGVEVESTGKTAEQQLSDVEILKADLDEVLLYFENKEKTHESLLNEKITFERALIDGAAQEDTVESGGEEIQVEGDVSLMDTFKEKMSSSASVWKPVIDLFR